ncbi:MAG: hypothetical protein JJU28_23945 [Cyclobacteriaceae bacterium]|nr:hypothetical protein [Cyclobacteriaceae bacterium]
MLPKSKISDRNLFYIAIDLLMMMLLIANLGLIIFDWFFRRDWFRELIAEQNESFYLFYTANIHEHFFEIDLAFIAVFLSEFVIRWGIAIYFKTYHKWFFYPFIHWYDLVGCIPIGSLRFARLFRVFSILYRFQKIGFIDLKKTYIFKQIRFYYDVLVEEISDRVVINVLNGVQDEIRDGGPVIDRIIDEIIIPKKSILVDWFSHRIQLAVHESYHLRREEIREYIDNTIVDAISKSREVGAIEQIPIAGKLITQTLGSGISSIVYNVIDGIIRDVGSDDNRILIEELLDIAIDTVENEEKDIQLNEIAIESFIRILEIIKDQVKVKKWKESL